jgi:hypothetical protein
MISAISTAAHIYAQSATESTHTRPAAQQKTITHDTVQLSKAALAAAADKDHDGDSR